jgi:hypothetical protein
MALMQAGRLFQNLLRERLHAQALHASACPCALRSGLQARTGNAAEWESTSHAAQGRELVFCLDVYDYNTLGSCLPVSSLDDIPKE